jgi:hypothetical protein
MANVKSFEEWSSGKSEELVHGTPGEDTSKNKGDQSGSAPFGINEESPCSTDCQGMVKEMYERMCGEMKELHGGKSKGNAQDYYEACCEMMEMCNASLKAECDKYMNRK